MSVLFIAVPLALALATAAVVAFIRSVRSGQFDDLQTPAVRMLFDDGEATGSGSTSSGRHDPSQGN